MRLSPWYHWQPYTSREIIRLAVEENVFIFFKNTTSEN